MKLWHWKSHWKFLWHWKNTETTLKNIYKGNHSDNPGLSHWNIFLCCSRTLKSHWKVLNHTEKFSALLIPFVPRFFSVTVNFQYDFQCHNFIVNARPLHVWLKCRTITTQARESVADLSHNCKGFRVCESVHARVTESRAQGTGVGRDIRQTPSRVRSVFLLIYAFQPQCHIEFYTNFAFFPQCHIIKLSTLFKTISFNQRATQ